MTDSLLRILTILFCLSTVACSKNEENSTPVVSESKVFYAQVPTSQNGTKTFIDGDWNMYWFSGDLLSVFQSATNEQYLFAGTSGEIINEFHKCDSSIPGAAYSRNYAVYPYANATVCDSNGEITISLPAVQQYSPDTFGQDANTMVAVTQSSADDVFYFRNVCGYLRLKIYGGDTIRRIVLRGNNGEKIAGEAIITAGYDTAPSVVLGESATAEITLDCGEDGVGTVDDPDQYTSFWIVVPPVTFTKGFTVDITTLNGITKSQTTEKSITITQNKVKQMASFECDSQSNPMLHTFSISDGVHTYEAYDISDGYVNIMVPNQSDLSNMTSKFTYRGTSVKVDDVEQKSGENAHDFSDFASPIEYTVSAKDETYQTYKVRIFDIPVLFIETPNHQAVTSKTEWVEGVVAKMRNTDDSEIDLGLMSMKVRGNTTGARPKKPYNIKFSSKQSILDMPKHKKWCLMANYFDRTLMRNAICQEIAGLADGIDWRVHGKFVELIMNGNHIGNYWLCEKIEVDENRINIDKENGFLLEYDHWEDDYRFTPKLAKGVFVKLKAPVDCPEDDPDSTKIKQAISYVDDLESVMMTGNEGVYIKCLDVDSFVDVLLIQEFCVNRDAATNNGYMYHNIDGILHAGPVWDFDLGSFAEKGHSVTNGLYYPTLLSGNYFKFKVQQRWNIFKAKLECTTIPDYINALYESNKRSALRDETIWPPAEKKPADLLNRNGDNQLSIEEAKDRILQNYQYQLIWLNNWVNSLVVNYDGKSGGNEDYGDQNDDSGSFDFQF